MCWCTYIIIIIIMMPAVFHACYLYCVDAHMRLHPLAIRRELVMGRIGDGVHGFVVSMLQ